MKDSKYIVGADTYTGLPAIRIFPSMESHANVYADMQHHVTLQSAGFCRRDESGKWICFGRSSSLNTEARREDAPMLNSFLS